MGQKRKRKRIRQLLSCINSRILSNAEKEILHTNTKKTSISTKIIKRQTGIELFQES